MYTQKTLLLDVENLLLDANRQKKAAMQSKPVGNNKGDYSVIVIICLFLVCPNHRV